MTVTLRLRNVPTIPVSLKGIVPERFRDCAQSEWSKFVVAVGNQKVPIAEWFQVEVTGQPSAEENLHDELTLIGDLSNFHEIGHGLSEGSIVVQGNVGHSLGSGMTGGHIIVRGSAGCYAGAQIKGGKIDIEGNALDWLGAAYSGSKLGMQGGQITVGGSAGHGAGYRMRRGCIVIRQNAGRRLGWDMFAGTIVVGETVAQQCGTRMKRGTIILTSPASAAKNTAQIPITFSVGSQVQPVFMQLLLRSLGNPKFFPQHQLYQIHHGDHLKGGRGEIIVAANERL